LHGGSGGAEGEYWPKVVEGFNQRQSRARAVFEPWPAGQSPLTLGAAGSLGDVMRLVAFSTYSQVAAKGFLKDLAPLIAKDRYDLKPFYAAALDTLKFRGKQFGLPHIAHPGFCGQFINLEALKQAGLPEPNEATWTLADLQRIARQLSAAGRDAGEQWGMWPATNVQHVTVAARAHGGNTLDKDGKRSLIGEPASAQGVQFLADLIHRDRAAPPPGVLEGSDVQNLIAGRVALVWTNFGIINTLRRQGQGLQWRVFLGPKGPQGRGFFMGVDAASQNAESKHPDQAFELVKYVVSREVSLGWFDHGFAPGGRHDTWNDPKITADAAFKVFARAMDEAAPLHLPHNGLITDYNNALSAELANVWAGKVSVRDGVEAARRAGQEVLDRPG
jgi:multiple sugar transport system substrate-binding protein